MAENPHAPELNFLSPLFDAERVLVGPTHEQPHPLAAVDVPSSLIRVSQVSLCCVPQHSRRTVFAASSNK
jgi:hypothetical protein